MATEQTTLQTPSTYDRVVAVAGKLPQNPKAAAGITIVGIVFLLSLLGPFIVPYDPLQTDMANRFASPSLQHPFGTDEMGRDLLSRVIIGSRTTLFLGISASGLAMLLGVPIGIIAGYKRGTTDEILMRLMDMIMSLPTLLLGILILTVLPPNIWNLILAIGIVYTPRFARVIRSATLSESTKDYVKIARLRDESDTHIMFREVLPNVMSPILVEGSVRIGFAILVGSSLTFLGLGTQPPYPDWGFMVASSRNYMFQSMWYVLWPSFALLITIFGFNLLGDGLRDILDPQTGRDAR